MNPLYPLFFFVAIIGFAFLYNLTLANTLHFENGLGDKRVYGLVGYSVNVSLAQWLKDRGFTDIAMRHYGLLNDSELWSSCYALESVGLRYWDFYGFDSILSLNTTLETDLSRSIFYNRTRNLLLNSMRGNIFLDDMDTLIDTYGVGVYRSVLKGIKQACSYSGSVLLIQELVDHGFHFPLYEQLAGEFQGLNILFYDYPYETYENSQIETLINLKALSISLTLWSFKGGIHAQLGRDWRDLTHDQITAFYNRATALKCEGVFIFEVWESDEFEEGLSDSSLYNFPEFYTVIENSNKLFLRSEV